MSRKNEMQKMEPSGEGTVERVQQRQAIAPRVDVYENENELLLIADVPGVDEKRLKIHLEKEQLTIEGQREEGRLGKPLASEYRTLDFHRTFLVHQGIDAGKISAELTQGVLRLHLPKAEGIRPRQIQVKAG